VSILAERTDGLHQVLPFNLTFTPVTLDEMVSPCLVLSDDQAGDFLQGFAQALAEAGYFPDITQNKESDLKATEYYLEDMRALVFNDALWNFLVPSYQEINGTQVRNMDIKVGRDNRGI